jgi:glutaredoxin|tara:strand:+ start:561 stop:932 length:372 start_codon:yes stop_codon:yes gene_type:complete
MNKITIYTNDTCSYCKQIKEELSKNNIEFENILTTDNLEEWQSIVNFTGMPTVPTICINGEYFVPGRDFGNADLLIKLIQNYASSLYTVEEVMLEKIKTLNYNMSMAFNRTNQILTKIEEKLK